ncbi:hypothetical protein SO694_00093028 [Aureococcus anophagefferens]|uniref:Uncharacterized protein n=1 Tax=Aureococcus anophagefferens TaxID=44056 RepID=A0ABR1FRN0_AURAN
MLQTKQLGIEVAELAGRGRGVLATMTHPAGALVVPATEALAHSSPRALRAAAPPGAGRRAAFEEYDAAARSLLRSDRRCPRLVAQVAARLATEPAEGSAYAVAVANLYDNKIDGPIPTEIGLLTALDYLRVPPRPDAGPARRATVPRRRRELGNNKIGGPIPPEIGQLTALKDLRVPAASPTPGAPRDRPRHRRYLENNQITGPIRPRSASSAKLTDLRVPPRPQRPARRATALDVAVRVLRRLRQRPRRAVRRAGLLRSRRRRETCSGGGGVCSGLAKKTCKKFAGCAYEKKTCSAEKTCSELSKSECKETGGCDYKNKQCSTSSETTCSELSKSECKETDGCDYKNKQCSTSAETTCSELSKKKCKKTGGCDYKNKQCSTSSETSEMTACSELSKKKCKKTDGCDYKNKLCSTSSETSELTTCSELSKKKSGSAKASKFSTDRSKGRDSSS